MGVESLSLHHIPKFHRWHHGVIGHLCTVEKDTLKTGNGVCSGNRLSPRGLSRASAVFSFWVTCSFWVAIQMISSFLLASDYFTEAGSAMTFLYHFPLWRGRLSICSLDSFIWGNKEKNQIIIFNISMLQWFSFFQHTLSNKCLSQITLYGLLIPSRSHSWAIKKCDCTLVTSLFFQVAAL